MTMQTQTTAPTCELAVATTTTIEEVPSSPAAKAELKPQSASRQESDIRLLPASGQRHRKWPLQRACVFLVMVCASGAVGALAAANMVHGAPPPIRALRPTNIIFMVADGFGPASATLARVLKDRQYKLEPTAAGGMQPLHLDTFTTGQVHTSSADHLITDSAAGATAWSCGRKTNNEFLAVDPLERPCATLMEAAKAAGMATGVAVTASVTDASTAAFATHARRRSLERSIALQYARGGPDVILGGGRRRFEEEQPLVETMRRERGYAVVHERAGLHAARSAPLVGLFAEEHLPWEIDRPPEAVPSLAEMAAKAAELLSKQERGFFLVVEGSRIDQAAHPNDAAAHAREVLAYDDAVGAMLAFARRDGRTLVVATADHETGGLALGRGVVADVQVEEAPLRTRALAAEARGTLAAPADFDVDVLRGVTMSAEAMTAAALAENGAPRAAALAANSTLRRQLVISLTVRLQGAARLGVLERHELALLREAVDLYASLGAYGVPRAVGAIVSGRAGLGWSTFGHTGVDVTLHALGPGSEALRGPMENFEVGRRIERVMGWDLDRLTAELPAPEMAALDAEDPQTAAFAVWKTG